MGENVYKTLMNYRNERRDDVVAEPAFRQGYIFPGYAMGETPAETFENGVWEWTRIAMATVISAGDAIGWDNYMDLLEKYQRKNNYKMAMRLKEQFNIEGTSPASCVNLMVSHAKGDLFAWHRHPVVSEHNMVGIGTYCPQVKAIEEMGMSDRAQNIRLWCDAFDALIAQALNPNVRMVHAHCPCRGDNYCLFYIFEEEDPSGSRFSEQIKKYNSRKREELKENPEPDYFEGLLAPRFIEGLTPFEIFKDGIKAKSGIALESMIIALHELGIPKYLDIISKEHSPGYARTAIKLRKKYDRNGTDLRDAANLMQINYATIGFDDLNITKYDAESVEGVADNCRIINAAERLGLKDNLEEISLWCDFYHNHFVHAVNPKYQMTHTHCLGRGDKYCRFVMK